MKYSFSNNVLQNWSWMRVLRLAMGLFILIDGIMTRDALFLTLGIVFTLLPIINIGGCAPNGGCSNNDCPVDFSQEKNPKEKEE